MSDLGQLQVSNGQYLVALFETPKPIATKVLSYLFGRVDSRKSIDFYNFFLMGLRHI